jgi:hypothetical protein
MRYIKALFPLIMLLLIGFHLCALTLFITDPALVILAVFFIFAPSVAMGAIIEGLNTQEAK